MKSQMSALDLRAAVAECQGLVKARIVKAQATPSMIAIGVHVGGKGKGWLVARLPGFFFMAEDRPAVTGSSPFEAALKKHLEGCRVDAIEQIGMERAVEVSCSSKGGSFSVVVELFAPGNAFLVKDGNILLLLKPEMKKIHEIGKPYQQPKSSVWEMTTSQVEELLASSKDPVSSLLASNGLGSLYAKEACLRAGVDPAQPSSRNNANRIAAAINNLRSEPFHPQKVLKDGQTVDVIPFPLKVYEGFALEPTRMGKAIGECLESVAPLPSPLEGKLKKVDRILESQRAYLSTLEREAADETRCGELVFEKYVLVKEVLDELQKARERLSWKEIKARLTNHPIIKEIHEAKGEIVVEL